MSSSEFIVPALAKSLAKRGYETLTPVQDAVLAPELAGEDLIVSAQTGSGKTVAFGLAMARDLLDGEETFSKSRAPLALVIAPTRELAMQVKRELDWLYADAKANVVSCVGGMDARDERRALERGCHIVVGTPGRLVDHIRRGALNMNSLEAIVLDEADEMLNMGFREELEHILDASPEERRTLMFSATMPRAIEALAKKYQHDAQRVNTVGERKQHLDIEYRALSAAPHDAENAIFNVLRFYDATNAIVFCGTRAAVSRMTSRFSNRGFSVVALSGELSQKERSHALQAMRDHRAQVCVATDVAARGIDLPDLELVIHADLPRNKEALLHRSGRTGRAGRKGTSVLIVPHRARKKAERLLKDAKITADWAEPPTAEEIGARDDERLLTDEIWAQAADDKTTALASQLVAQRSPEEIAAAFIHLHRKGKSAPEDLLPPPPKEERSRGKDRERKPRDNQRRAKPGDFEDGVWVTLGVGRAKHADPKWILPMMCKAGGLAKKDIGVINIEDRVTHVEIASDAIDGFFEAVGPEGRLEKSINVSRKGEAPVETRQRKAPADNRPPKSHIKRPANKPVRSEVWSPDSQPKGRKPKRTKPEDGAQKSFDDKPKPKRRKPSNLKGKPGGKPPGKAPGKKKGPSKTPATNRNKRSWKPPA